MPIDFSKLKKQRMYVYRDGLRVGRVLSIDGGPRKGLRSLRLATPSYEGRNRWGWNGPTFKADGRDARAPGAGVLFRRRVIPIDQFISQKGVQLQ